MRKHFAAVKARLEASSVLAGRVYNTFAVDASGAPIRTAYVILYGGAPDVLNDDRVTAPQSRDSDAEYVYTVRSVGPTADSALATADVATGQLIGFVPTVAGRRCSKIKLEDGGVVELDNSIKPPLFYIDQDFLLISRRG